MPARAAAGEVVEEEEAEERESQRGLGRAAEGGGGEEKKEEVDTAAKAEAEEPGERENLVSSRSRRPCFARAHAALLRRCSRDAPATLASWDPGEINDDASFLELPARSPPIFHSSARDPPVTLFARAPPNAATERDMLVT